MRALKALVVVLGLLIVVVLTVIGVTMVRRMGEASSRGAPFQAEVATGQGVIDMTASDGRLLLRHRAGAGERITVIDLASGRVTGTIDLKPAP